MLQPHTLEPSRDRRPTRALWHRVGAGLSPLVASALRVVALFSVVQLSLEVVAFGAPGHWVWIDLDWMSPWLAALWLSVFGIGVLTWSCLSDRMAGAVRAVVASAAVMCVVDAARFYTGWLAGDFGSALPVPLSLVIAVGAGWWVWRPPRRGVRWRLWHGCGRLALDGAMAVACLLVFCIAFGSSDYRRAADAIVVFGAAVHPDGTPSLSVEDRTRTGCRLYLEGRAGKLVLSGGHSEGVVVSEPVAMRRIAREMGVPERDIVLDEAGVNTLATVKNCVRLAADHGWTSLLMVSHDYHLARIKMFCAREDLAGYTVPAEESRPLARKKFFYMRELAALVTYFLLPRLSL